MYINDQVKTILNKVAEKINWKNYEVSTNIDHETGNGFLGEFFLASIINKDTKDKVDLAVKCAFKNEDRRKDANIPLAFKNEICFYDIIVPELYTFAKEKGLVETFDFIPKYYTCIKDNLNECLVLENLRTIGYQCVDRDQLMDEEHIKLVFKTYGKFHGLTFAFKDTKPKEYIILLQNSGDLVRAISNQENNEFPESLRKACKDGFGIVDEDIKTACKHYIDNPFSILNKYYNNYEGKHSSLIHGDCWSNNMMFKYKGTKVTNMKLIDFQLIKDGSPVFDLSYFLYVGGSLETYSNLDKFLKIYHDSFSQTVIQLGCDPEKLLPWTALKDDWKKYSKTGLLIGILANKVKLMSNDNIQTLVDESSVLKHMGSIKLDTEALNRFQNRCKNLIEHVYKEGFLDLS